MPEWFEEWFGDEYLQLYPHRDGDDADRLIALLERTLPWQPGWRVLDVACGAGRHLAALERRGAAAFGVDLSRTLLQRARHATARPVSRADMRRLPIRSHSMDLTVNLFTSFGYFTTDVEHQGAIAEMLGTVRPGGWFAMDFLNADRVRATLVSDETATMGGVAVRIQRAVSGDGRVVHKTMELPGDRRFVEQVRLFAPMELEQMISRAGGTVTARYGDYDGAPLGSGPRTILVARLPA